MSTSLGEMCTFITLISYNKFNNTFSDRLISGLGNSVDFEIVVVSSYTAPGLYLISGFFQVFARLVDLLLASLSDCLSKSSSLLRTLFLLSGDELHKT